jgi:histidinol phosphatase-like enzyme (inositol monophosphatase family)
MPTPLQPPLEFALDAVWQAGRITLGYFQTAIDIERKTDNSPVTIADRESEKWLRELFARFWPDHGVIGEEFGETPSKNGLTWIVDPIDGTKSFIHGVPIYAVLLALVEGTDSGYYPLVGVAHFPALGETVYAARGQGCFWNGRRTHTSVVSDISEATLLSSEIVVSKEAHAAPFQRLIDATPIHRTWGDAYGYALVATGRAEIMLDSAMQIWDCGPFSVILEESGGTFTDWRGTPTIEAGESIATNGTLYNQVMALVNG